MQKKYPVITLLGPRQSGKTTLVRAAFPEKPYVNMEDAENRSLATLDPLSFMKAYPQGAILDEVQRVPHLLSYIQVRVDEVEEQGMFILGRVPKFGATARIFMKMTPENRQVFSFAEVLFL